METKNYSLTDVLIRVLVAIGTLVIVQMLIPLVRILLDTLWRLMKIVGNAAKMLIVTGWIMLIGVVKTLWALVFARSKPATVEVKTLNG